MSKFAKTALMMYGVDPAVAILLFWGMFQIYQPQNVTPLHGLVYALFALAITIILVTLTIVSVDGKRPRRQSCRANPR